MAVARPPRACSADETHSPAAASSGSAARRNGLEPFLLGVQPCELFIGRVTGCRGELKIVETSETTTRPAYMTMTRSEPAISPRSCVIKIVAAFVCSWRRASPRRISAWIVTSSAYGRLVGDQKAGSSRSPWRSWRVPMPPENSSDTGRTASRRRTRRPPRRCTVRACAFLCPSSPAGGSSPPPSGSHLGPGQRRHRVLEDHRRPRRRGHPESLLRHRQEVVALVQGLPADDPARASRDQPKHRHHPRRFPEPDSPTRPASPRAQS